MPASSWMKVTRPDDGETVGYLEPLAADWSLVQPRSLLGHLVGEPGDFLDAEQRLIQRGIAELAESWELRAADSGLRDGVVILEVSPDGIVVAHADLTKELVFNQRVTVPWPDLDGVLLRKD